VLHVVLDDRVVELTSDQSLGVENGVGRVHGYLVLGGITDQPLAVVESNVRGGGSVTLVVGDDFDFTMLEDTYARVGGSEIDTDGGHFYLYIFENYNLENLWFLAFVLEMDSFSVSST